MNKVTSVLLCLPLLISLHNAQHQDVTGLKSTNMVSLVNKFDKNLDRLEEDRQRDMLNEMSVSLNCQQEQKRIEEEEKRRKEEEEAKYITKTFIITFYTDLNSENGWGAVNCRGEQLVEGMVANNVLPLGTEIDLGNMGTVRVSDRGGSDFNNSDRLDMLIPREHGESDSHYFKRVNNMGKRVVTGKILRSSLESI